MHKNYIRYKAKTKELIYDLKYIWHIFFFENINFEMHEITFSAVP